MTGLLSVRSSSKQTCNIAVDIKMLTIVLLCTTLLSVGDITMQKEVGVKSYPMLNAVPITSFTCGSKPAGYYADPEAGCQAYHMCDILEKQYSYLCPNHTLFNQKFMVCDHWHVVNCSASHQFYSLNLHIGGDTASRSSVRTNISAADKRTRQEAKDITQSAKPSSEFIEATTDGSPTKSTRKVSLQKTHNEMLTTKTRAVHTDSEAPGVNVNIKSLEQRSSLTGRGSANGIRFRAPDNPNSTDNSNDKFSQHNSRPRSHSVFENTTFTIPPFILNSTSPFPTTSFQVPKNNITEQSPFLSLKVTAPGLTSFALTLNNKFHLINNISLPSASARMIAPKFHDISPDFFAPNDPVVFDGLGQELLTPLTLKLRQNLPSSLKASQRERPDSGKFGTGNSVRPVMEQINAAFFIPHTERVHEKLENDAQSVENVIKSTEQQLHKRGEMTMTFPPLSLQKHNVLRLNPSCPHCHPTFLKPNECIPCVIIK